MPIAINEKKKNGDTIYIAQVRVRKTKLNFRRVETERFNQKRFAMAWAAKKEKEYLDEYQALLAGEQPEQKIKSDTKLKDYLQQVLDYMDTIPEDERFNDADLSTIRKWQNYPIAELTSGQFTTTALIDHFERRIREDKIAPTTNHRDLVPLNRAIKWQKRVKATFPDLINDEFKKELWELNLTGKSKYNDYRPTEEQIYQIFKHCMIRDLHPNSKISYSHTMLFAIYSTFRISEICNLKWSNYNEATGEIILEDRKDPNNKWGNHEKIPLHPECIQLIELQKRKASKGEEKIFPFNSKSISSKFNKITHALGVPEITFHAFRHEGISRLFEQGYNIPQVAVHSGHKNWNNLRRYTHLFQKEVPDLFTHCMKMQEDYHNKLKLRMFGDV